MVRIMGVAALMATVATAAPAGAAETMRFWNQTTEELVEVVLAPVGTDKWGSNQCLNDNDKSVESDERLRLKDVTPGVYDVRVRDVHDRTCFARNIEVKSGGKYAFAIEDKQLVDCNK